MTEKLKTIEELIEGYEKNSTLFKKLRKSYEEEIKFNRLIKDNEREALELLKNPTKENLLAVKNYLRSLCGLFKIPFKDELDLDSLSFE